LRHYLSILCGLAWTAVLSVIAAAGLTVTVSRPALAEYEIQETDVEKGEAEVEYRGAVHSGFTKGEEKAAGTEGTAADIDEEQGEFLRQSHDLEFQYGLTDRFMFSTSITADEPLDKDFNLSAVELEAQYEVIERKGDGIGFALDASYSFATRGGEADEFQFAPYVEWASGPLMLTINPYFGTQVGNNRDTNGLGFEYGWRAEYKVAPRWGLGVEMFGEIDELAHTGPFNAQTHSIGPTLFFDPFGGDDEDAGGEGDADEDDAAGASQASLSLNVGVQFGLTDATSDTALKFQGSLQF
jgi:hypothetical protein